ncbi:hypothetical protein ACEPAI_3360 [Sanghuangporus weigelae]
MSDSNSSDSENRDRRAETQDVSAAVLHLLQGAPDVEESGLIDWEQAAGQYSESWQIIPRTNYRTDNEVETLPIVPHLFGRLRKWFEEHRGRLLGEVLGVGRETSEAEEEDLYDQSTNQRWALRFWSFFVATVLLGARMIWRHLDRLASNRCWWAELLLEACQTLFENEDWPQSALTVHWDPEVAVRLDA